jgi:hypothetical protein
MVDRVTMGERTTLQTVALVVGVVFLILGIIGFIPGITTDAPGSFTGEDSDAKILGIFHTSILHNLVHLLFGIAGLALARTWDGARTFLIGGGVIYVVLWLLGLFGALNWLPADDADHWLHLGVGVVMIGAGYLLSREAATRAAAT